MGVLYATTNPVKLSQAKAVCAPEGITLEQLVCDIDEIQGEDPKYIALDKAQKVYDYVQKPVIISDDSWAIPALNGFPGAYMKSINTWFSPDDWLRLTRELADRRILLTQIVVFQDASGATLFEKTIVGQLVTDARGQSPYPHCLITSFDEGKTTLAEWHEKNESDTKKIANVWHDFAAWYKEKLK